MCGGYSVAFDGGWVDLEEGGCIGSDGLTEVVLKEGHWDEVAIRLYLHLPSAATAAAESVSAAISVVVAALLLDV